MSSAPAVIADAEAMRGELIGFCYRYFGSYADAEDAVQETMVRAWQRAGQFEERASLRTWIYAIAANICLDMKRAPQRRSLPMDLSSAGDVPGDPSTLTMRPEMTSIGPICDDRLAMPVDPADAAVARESIRLAFVAALQLLPPRQRVILILRDVLAWSARECADLLELTVASVNSALARARKTVGEHDRHPEQMQPAEEDEKLLMNYVAAFEAYDVERLVGLLAEDARFSMPPYELWMQGAEVIERWWRGPGRVCVNSRVIVVGANGQPAAAAYHDVGGGRWEPWAIHVLDTRDGRITGITHFMGPEVFAQFGLPDAITDSGEVAE